MLGHRFDNASGQPLSAEDRDFIWEVSQSLSKALGVVAADAAAGLRELRRRPGPRVVTGSFYLAGEVRRALDASR